MSIKISAPRRGGLAVGLGAVAWLGASCGDAPPVRTYTQVTIQPARAAAPAGMPPAAAAPAGGGLQWEAPEGWREEAGSGMRLASWQAGDAGAEALVTLVSLTGEAGGAEANVRRWLDQLGHAFDTEEAFQAFLSGQAAIETAGGATGTLVDFTKLAPGDGAESMVAAILPLEGRTVFVKMTGPAGRLQAERDRLQALCESIRMAP